jgi:hypothetical protein
VSAQGRVSGGRPDGGQYTSTEHSDAVVTLSPTAQRMRSIAAIHSQQVAWLRQQEILDAQRDELASKIRDAATASAAIEMLDVLPQIATLSYRRDGSEVTFVEAVDADRNIIVSESDLCDWDNPWYKDRSFQEAARRSEERLEASELPLERWVDIDVNDAIAKAAARLESEAAPVLGLQRPAPGHTAGVGREQVPLVVLALQSLHLTLDGGEDEIRERPGSGQVPGRHVSGTHPRP